MKIGVFILIKKNFFMCTYTIIDNGVLYNTRIIFTVIYHLHIYQILPVIIKFLDEEDFQSTMVCEVIPTTASSKYQIESYS